MAGGLGGRTRLRRERGQVALALILSVTVGLVAVGIFGVVALSRGADEKSKAQSAADAAALAGADALVEDLPGRLGRLVGRGGLQGLFGCDLGRDAASDFAGRNEAQLTEYCYDARDDRVRVAVRMNEGVTEDVGPAEAEAEASAGIDFGSCSWRNEDPPTPTTTTPTTTSTAPPPTTPPPAPDFITQLNCGRLSARFQVNGETGKLQLVKVDIDDVEPRLER